MRYTTTGKRLLSGKMSDETGDSRLIIISGLSGAGKSVVLNALEDLGFYCIDNLPIVLLDKLFQYIDSNETKIPKQIATGIEVRSLLTGLSDLPDYISELKKQRVSAEIIFLDADNNVLTKRFSETRRKHPLSSDQLSLADAINEERELLAALFDLSDLHIDTSHTAVQGLREIVTRRIARREAGSLSMQFLSFGFKHGAPNDADFVLDVRCLPNPHWERSLRQYTGKDKPVIEFLSDKAPVRKMIEQLIAFFQSWIPLFESENRSYLTIAIGCTGPPMKVDLLILSHSDIGQTLPGTASLMMVVRYRRGADGITGIKPE